MTRLEVVETIHDGRWYTAQVEITESVDNSYGEDADGNRGVPRVVVDDATVLWAEDEDGHDIKFVSGDLERALIEEAVN